MDVPQLVEPMKVVPDSIPKRKGITDGLATSGSGGGDTPPPAKKNKGGDRRRSKPEPRFSKLKSNGNRVLVGAKSGTMDITPLLLDVGLLGGQDMDQ